MTPTPRHRAAADLGELITVFYQHFLEMYGDEDLAAVATAAVINNLLGTTDNGPAEFRRTVPTRP